ncbi:hypothetical protein [Paraburkholderia sp. BR14374]|uniref:hypothetical protein n=1 Tax=Paraburkholderia sp. BR14374 TaxID=3237007 RepID=UPI0034CF36A9
MDAIASKKVVFILNVLAAMAALTAAGLWFWSTRVEVEYVDPSPVDGWIPGSITFDNRNGKRVDPFATGIEQARRNRWAALAASAAAFCQGFAAILS